MTIDCECNPLGLCKWNRKGLSITDANKLDRLIKIYSIIKSFNVIIPFTGD